MKAATFEFFGLPRRLQVGSLSVYMLRFSVLCLGSSLYTKCIDHQRWGGAFGDVTTILGEESQVYRMDINTLWVGQRANLPESGQTKCPTGSSLIGLRDVSIMLSA